MSVADKLRALDASYEGATHIRADEKVARGLTLLDALPALIKVVEQAERWGSLEEFNVDTLEHVPTPLGAALAALDAALGGEKDGA